MSKAFSSSDQRCIDGFYRLYETARDRYGEPSEPLRDFGREGRVVERAEFAFAAGTAIVMILLLRRGTGDVVVAYRRSVS